ncbi:MAG: sugar ABC transporter ATP-binding protein [Alkalibacterium gilvum]|uniref:sugar ABC transporter ATP-binding protein n=1 Tax=Alkalibacterium gilvum TaxID=1130080 RepID=UPI003F92F807
MNEYILTLENITKEYPGVTALNNINISFEKGKTHGLVGENGAGKSTLIKLLTGAIDNTTGTIFYKGEELKQNSPIKSLDRKIIPVYQELNMIPTLSICDNIFYGHEMTKGVALDKKHMREKTSELLKQVGLKITPETKVKELGIGNQQLIEIAKALIKDVEVLILDEPTTSLTDVEKENLFSIIKDFKKRGISIIYISHRLDEVLQLSDTITVLRNGEVIDTKPAYERNEEELIKSMVGRNLSRSARSEENIIKKEKVLELKNVSTHKIKEVSFHLLEGEILGVAGLMGSGRTELAEAIFGIDQKISGEVFISQALKNIHSPKDAVDENIAFITEDRKSLGLMLDLSVLENVTYASLEGVTKKGIINKDEERQVVKEILEKLNVKYASLDEKVVNLSGGNQQKIVIAKWLLTNASILIFDEPTCGIDIGSKEEIYGILRDLAKEGKAIILISSENEEIMNITDRVLIMSNGRIASEYKSEELTADTLFKDSARLL